MTHFIASLLFWRIDLSLVYLTLREVTLINSKSATK